MSLDHTDALRPTRRRLLGSAPVAATALILASAMPRRGSAAGPADSPVIRAFREPGCGCCAGWAGHLRRAGFAVTLADAPDLGAVRRGAGVPEDLAGCHTGLIGERFVVEGHVPAVALRRFLADPAGWRGLAVPGMPLGSPGMEVPGANQEAYTVFAFAADGRRAPVMAMRGSQPA